MAATRKLQGEIDRVLKKVQEGVDVFDGIWNKVYDTENANQKEKFEADLKKEIKKLQRYRDQIKTWIQSNEIKDKKALLEARKVIERMMERFKVCEKETKTKAFSKEGLGQQPKTDPREKAKGESRDWLNTMVGDLELQTDAFEAEIEGLVVKKGKTRPPRLMHLEESIARHKQHILKLELLLRLLDNDELSPEQVNDVKDFVQDYVERNQDDFEEFAEPDDLYQSLPLDKLEALELLDAVPIAPPATVVKEKAPVTAASGASVGLKSPIPIPPTQQQSGAATAAVSLLQHIPSSSLLLEEGAVQESYGESGSGTPPTQSGREGSPTNTSNLYAGAFVTGAALPILPLGLGSVAPSMNSFLAVPSTRAVTTSQSTISQPVSTTVGGHSKEEESGNVIRRTMLGVGDGGLARTVGRSSFLAQSPPISVVGSLSSSAISSSDGKGSTAVNSDMERTGASGDERIGSGGLAQQLSTPFGSQNRVFVPSGGIGETASGQEGALIGGRMFSTSVGSHWRLPTASTFQNQAELGQFHGRTEIAPDQKQKYLQRLQVHQQGQTSSLLSAVASSHLSGVSQKSLKTLTPQQSPAVSQGHTFQQHQQQQKSSVQTSTSSQQSNLASGMEMPHVSISYTQSQQQQQSQPLSRSQSAQQLLQGSLSRTESAKELDPFIGGALDSQQLHKFTDDTDTDISSVASFSRSHSMSEEDSKNADTFDVVVGVPGTLADLSQLSRDASFIAGTSSLQAGQPLPGPSSVGRRSVLELGAGSASGNPLAGPIMHDQLFNRQALEAAYHNLPMPKDSERPKSYTPRYPAVTPASYPQLPAPIIENVALWDRLDTDVLFLAFYYHQGTYQQYLAARELKRQSWRYHKKYSTWFQRHEEPKVTTDEYEQGTYVYFDFHILHDDLQQGWCQRIKTEFTFEYSYLEDELVL
ncbi:CCR4-NOT transcription complex subunit 3 [Marchantia polymorpha subsp. ruderalis]